MSEYLEGLDDASLESCAYTIYGDAENAMSDIAYSTGYHELEAISDDNERSLKQECEAEQLWDDADTLQDLIGDRCSDAANGYVRANFKELKTFQESYPVEIDVGNLLVTALGILAVERNHPAMILACERCIGYTESEELVEAEDDEPELVTVHMNDFK